MADSEAKTEVKEEVKPEVKPEVTRAPRWLRIADGVRSWIGGGGRHTFPLSKYTPPLLSGP
jgi:hypothetical protein